MSDMWIDVDTAVAIPVNKLPLIDDTDFKTRETGIVYNQAGMDLVWNFVTSAGVMTHTAVTPTTAGDYDWTHVGDAMYKIEITATGGADINNDTEGYGWFTGICTGVLAWASPVYGFRAAALNDALVDGGDLLDVNVTKWVETAVGISSTSAKPEVDMFSVSDDATAANNMESQYDTTGLAGDTFPSTQSQLAGITNTGAAVNRPATTAVVTTGTETNTYASTAALDGVYHSIDDAIAVMDLYYEFSIGSGIPTSVTVTGYLNGNNDSLGVYGYDWVAAGWVQIGTLAGKAASTNEREAYDLFVDMVGTGANEGVVRVRFYAASGLTSATFAVDQIFLSFSQGSEGYENGAIWIDTTLSNTNTVAGIDGTARNPVSTIAAATTLSASTNLNRFSIAPGSAITLAQTYNNFVFVGADWTLALGTQDVGGSTFIGATVSGTGTGSSVINFERCSIGTATLSQFHLRDCSFTATVTLSAAGDYIGDFCHSGIAGETAPVVDTGVAVANVSLSMRHYSGGFDLRNLGQAGTDVVSIEGVGNVILNANCVGGTCVIRGNMSLTDNSATTAITQTARVDVDSVADAVWNEILTGATHNIADSAGRRLRNLQEFGWYEGGFVFIDTVTGTAGTTDYESGTNLKPVDTIADANTIATSLNLSRFKLTPASSITFAASQNNQIFDGDGWTVALGGQDISNAHIRGATVSGIGTGTAPEFHECFINSISMNPGTLKDCVINGTVTVTTAGTYTVDDCSGDGSTTIDLGSAIGATTVNISHFSGNIELQNVKAGDTVNLRGHGKVTLNANCTGGTLKWDGHFTVTDNSSTTTITSDDISSDVDGLVTTVGTAGAGLTDLGGMSTGMKGEVNAEVDTAISDAALATAANLATVDTVVDAIKAVTDLLPDGGALNDLALILADTAEIGTAGAGLTGLGGMSTGMKGEVNAEVDTALNTAIPGTPTADSVNERIKALDVDWGDGGRLDLLLDAIKVVTDALGATAAARLALSGGTMVIGTIDTTAFTPTVTEFEADDITEATATHYNGRIIIGTSGALQDQATDITGYVLTGGRGHFTVTALTEPFSNNDTFIIV